MTRERVFLTVKIPKVLRRPGIAGSGDKAEDFIERLKDMVSEEIVKNDDIWSGEVKISTGVSYDD